MYYECRYDNFRNTANSNFKVERHLEMFDLSRGTVNLHTETVLQMKIVGNESRKKFLIQFCFQCQLKDD